MTKKATFVYDRLSMFLVYHYEEILNENKTEIKIAFNPDDPASRLVADQCFFYDNFFAHILNDNVFWENLSEIVASLQEKGLKLSRLVPTYRGSHDSTQAHIEDENFRKIQYLANFLKDSKKYPWEKILNCYYIIVIVSDLDIDPEYTARTQVNKI